MAENEYNAATYGERIADVYDDWHTTYEEETIAPASSLGQLAARCVHSGERQTRLGLRAD